MNVCIFRLEMYNASMQAKQAENNSSLTLLKASKWVLWILVVLLAFVSLVDLYSGQVKYPELIILVVAAYGLREVHLRLKAEKIRRRSR
jgi:hypothetical protein